MQGKKKAMQLVGCSAAARHLGVSRSRVIQLENEGRLYAIRTPAGWRRFALHAVEQVAFELKSRRVARNQVK